MTAPLWLQVIQAAGGIATTIGVLIALYIALIRDPREASAEHKHHVAQMEALRNARPNASEHKRENWCHRALGRRCSGMRGGP
jgi:hypothetical protein